VFSLLQLLWLVQDLVIVYGEQELYIFCALFLKFRRCNWR